MLAVHASVYASPQHLRFAHLGLAEGLSNGTVNDMIQDREGFLWFATDDGLNRYDGYGFTVYRHRPDDSTSLSANAVYHLCLDPSGNLWMSTATGIDRYDRVNDRFVHAGRLARRLREIGAPASGQIDFDRSGTLWLSSGGLGVYACQPDSGRADPLRVGGAAPLGGPDVSAMYVDAADNLWIGYSHEGVAMLAPDRTTVMRYARIPGDTTRLLAVTAITGDAGGNIWIATKAGVVCRIDPRRNALAAVHPYGVHGGQWTMSLCVTAAGVLWLGTFGGGLHAWDTTRHVTVDYGSNQYDPGAIPGDRIYRILEDRSGSLWIGTWKEGVGVYHPFSAKFEHYTHAWYDPSSLSDLIVWSICQDRTGTLWVGTDKGGLNRLDRDGRGFTHFLHRPSDPRSIGADMIKAVVEDSQGTLWIGMVYGGLDSYDRAGGGFVHHRLRASGPGSLDDDRITALYVDREGVLWIGGKRLERYDRSTRRFVLCVAPPHGADFLGDTEVQSIVEDHRGNIWVGGFPAGLARLNKATGAVRTYADPSAVYDLHVDAEGTLWLSSFGKGLFAYDEAADTFRNFSLEDGLPSNFIKAIESDEHGVLWLGTSHGLARFDPRKKVARGYGPEDGVQAYEFRTGASFRARDGKLFFGGVNGFNAFYPDSVHDNRAVPPVVITALKVFDTPMPLGAAEPGEVRLGAGADFISLEFVALDYTAPARNRYAYMMEGLDRSWVNAGTRRYASYAHLEPGEYVFRVKGANGDGVWNEEGAAVRLVLLPPFWSTWWFRIGAVLALAGVVYLSYRYRLAKLLEVERTRASIATDLHDDIGTSLTNIALFSDLAQRDIAAGTPGVTQRLERISETSRSLLDAMNDIVWSIKPENDALEKTVLRMEDYAVAILEENGIDLHVEIPERLRSLRLPMAVRRSLFLIFKEAIANILKHAGATRVEVAIAAVEAGRGAQIRLVITDDGRGFDTAVPSSGDGLTNMAKRARKLDGSVDIRSASAAGTRVEIVLPLRSPR